MKIFYEFIRLESVGGALLLIAAIAALIIGNSPLHSYYQTFFNHTLDFHVGILDLSKSLLLWINDGFMAVFFLLVGLEVKREIYVGELNSFSKSLLPIIAAVGGMVVPVFIYVIFNWGNSVALNGWAIPSATDIAFSLGILALLGSRIPSSLKFFLMTLAIIDDIGAIIIIAIFYAKKISLFMLIMACLFILLLFILNRIKVTSIFPYIVGGIALWLCVLKSGVHATLAGVIIAWAIPLSRSHKVERWLHPWVILLILPLFAFANMGISFTAITLHELCNPVTVGIALGLFFGKQIGITLATYLSVKMRWVSMPAGANWSGIYGISLIAGVGFTMSLFIGTLAFGDLDNHYAMWVKLGVMLGSMLSGVAGYWVLRFSHSR